MTDQTRAALEKRLSAMIGELNSRRAADLDNGCSYSPDTLSYEDLTRGYSHAVNALRTMSPGQVRERVHDLEHAAGNASLLVRPSWAYIRGASACAILAQKLERTAQ